MVLCLFPDNLVEHCLVLPKFNKIPASWSSGNVFVSGAGDLRFNYRVGQIRHNVANCSPPLRHFFEKSCVAWVQWRRDGPHKLVIRFVVIPHVSWIIWFAISLYQVIWSNKVPENIETNFRRVLPLIGNSLLHSELQVGPAILVRVRA